MGPQGRCVLDRYGIKSRKKAQGTARELQSLDALESDNETSEEEEEETQKRNQLQTWRSNLIGDNLNTIYIERFKGSPLSIEVSIFKQTRAIDRGDDARGGINKAAILDLLGNLGLQFTTITGAPLRLNALEIKNVYGSQAIVTEQLKQHYMSTIKSNVLKFIGSTDLLGNPTDFVETLGTGVEQFYYAPRDGFMQGPLQGGLGLIKGTSSLMVHTLGGVSGSVSKITNTINRGFLVLSADLEYRQMKEISDIRDRPTGVIDGLKKGVLGFGYSVWSGVSGIVSLPMQGMKTDGAKGFGMGLGMGVLGTVVKPVSGVVDLVSKTTEGIENAVDGDVNEENNKQMRLARAFYKEAGVFKVYSKLNAQLYEMVRSTAGGLGVGVQT